MAQVRAMVVRRREDLFYAFRAAESFLSAIYGHRPNTLFFAPGRRGGAIFSPDVLGARLSTSTDIFFAKCQRSDEDNYNPLHLPVPAPRLVGDLPLSDPPLGVVLWPHHRMGVGH
ncbi:unnamed protein product [Chondrus crispus]|uniref:Uncharacterized protein n=1 Tax=Chondrus crispus TaxID=2769 RepID=R7Q905_CHOCR|nr:unnamed protein product [Chondrus crispus]CDF34298.1 unnamed protein product [Chondrus crispus]|eukprot:XP_005714117.1 unnamed protein product [Chondrus crispus]